MKRRTLLIAAMALLVFIGGAYLLYGRLAYDYGQVGLTPQDTSTSQDSQAAQTAPDFTIMDWDGNTTTLHDFIGKPIIVNFWASWCGPCKSEMPALEDAWQQYGEEIHFLIINLTDGSRETEASARAYIEQMGYTFPVYFDTTLSAAMTYGASSIPLTYFLSADGVAIARHIGALDEDLLQQGIDLIQ